MESVSLTAGLAKLFFLAACQIGTWWFMINLVNRAIKRDTAQDYAACKDGNLGPAIIRAAIIFGMAYMVSGAFSRWV